MCAQPVNRQIILISRPNGMPKDSDFAIREAPIPKPEDGEVLVRSLFLTVDPYMRGRMNDQLSYMPAFPLNAAPAGGVVARVIESRSANFKAGDIVLGFLQWTDYAVAKESELQKLNPKRAPITTALGILGMPGMTAYFGLLEVGKPRAGETIVVSGAAGAVGSAVGQIGKIKECRVVGIAGSDEKVNYLVGELGFDAAINYKAQDYANLLKKACPNGVDVYFDNVGGNVTDDVLQLINKNARMPICGQISMYNLDKPDIGPRNWWLLLIRTAVAQGFMVSDYQSRFEEGMRQMGQWIRDDKIKYRETIVDGLENTPKAFLGLFKGENVGKQLVKVAD